MSALVRAYAAKPREDNSDQGPNSQSVRTARLTRGGRDSGMRQGWPPHGQDRKAGLVHKSPARSESEGRRPTQFL